MIIADLQCDCGSADLIAVDPGSALVVTDRHIVENGRPARAWCRACWPVAREKTNDHDQ